MDESWIDAMERREAKEKEASQTPSWLDFSSRLAVALCQAKERAAAQRRERKHAARARPVHHAFAMCDFCGARTVR